MSYNIKSPKGGICDSAPEVQAETKLTQDSENLAVSGKFSRPKNKGFLDYLELSMEQLQEKQNRSNEQIGALFARGPLKGNRPNGDKRFDDQRAMMLKNMPRPHFWHKVLHIVSQCHEYQEKLKQFDGSSMAARIQDLDKQMIDPIRSIRRCMFNAHLVNFSKDNKNFVSPENQQEFDAFIEFLQQDNSVMDLLLLGDENFIKSYLFCLTNLHTNNNILCIKCPLKMPDRTIINRQSVKFFEFIRSKGFNVSELMERVTFNKFYNGFINQISETPLGVPKDYQPGLVQTSLAENKTITEALALLQGLLDEKRSITNISGPVKKLLGHLGNIAKWVKDAYSILYYSHRTIEKEMLKEGDGFDPQKFDLQQIVSALFTESRFKFGTIYQDEADAPRHFIKVKNLCQKLVDCQTTIVQAIGIQSELAQQWPLRSPGMDLSSLEFARESKFAMEEKLAMERLLTLATSTLRDLQADISMHLDILMAGLIERNDRFARLNDKEKALEIKECYEAQAKRKSQFTLKEFYPVEVRGMLHEMFYPHYFSAMKTLMCLKVYETLSVKTKQDFSAILPEKNKALSKPQGLSQKNLSLESIVALYYDDHLDFNIQCEIAKTIAKRLNSFSESPEGSDEDFNIEYYQKLGKCGDNVDASERLKVRDAALIAFCSQSPMRNPMTETHELLVRSMDAETAKTISKLSAFLYAEKLHLDQFKRKLVKLMVKSAAEAGLYLPNQTLSSDMDLIKSYLDQSYYENFILTQHMTSQRIFCSFVGLNKYLKDNTISSEVRLGVDSRMKSAANFCDRVMSFILPPKDDENFKRYVRENISQGYSKNVKHHLDDLPYTRTAEVMIDLWRRFLWKQNSKKNTLQNKAQEECSAEVFRNANKYMPMYARLTRTMMDVANTDARMNKKGMRPKPNIEIPKVVFSLDPKNRLNTTGT